MSHTRNVVCTAISLHKNVTNTAFSKVQQCHEHSILITKAMSKLQ